mgnify:CR=1 FL=1
MRLTAGAVVVTGRLESAGNDPRRRLERGGAIHKPCKGERRLGKGSSLCRRSSFGVGVGVLGAGVASVCVSRSIISTFCWCSTCESFRPVSGTGICWGDAPRDDIFGRVGTLLGSSPGAAVSVGFDVLAAGCVCSTCSFSCVFTVVSANNGAHAIVDTVLRSWSSDTRLSLPNKLPHTHTRQCSVGPDHCRRASNKVNHPRSGLL